MEGEIRHENAAEKRNGRQCVLIEDGRIIGLGDYAPSDADVVQDASGRYICPGLIDGHMHIESTMLTPAELARAVLPHGTTAVVADPHEIANVCGTDGIDYMLGMSEGLPLSVYVMLPSCVPATPFDESGAVLRAAALEPYYQEPRVLGLAEMMNYPSVLAGDADVLRKIADAERHHRAVDGHAPLLTGHDLDTYIAAGVQSDHECSSLAEARERIAKGQWVMIRQGTAAHNLPALIDLFDEPWSRRCLLVTDDRHPADILREGHIDHMIRMAVQMGKGAVSAIRMASLQAAQCFGLHRVGAVAPGWRADLLVLDELDTFAIRDVYCAGRRVVHNGQMAAIPAPTVSQTLLDAVHHSCHASPLTAADFALAGGTRRCRVIRTVPGELLTEEWITELALGRNGGVDLERNIVKLAVVERHHNTGHKGIGFVSGLGLQHGAVVSTVSHDSHNIVVIGTNDEDMAFAVNYILSIGGGCAAVRGGKVLAEVPLPVAGLMSEQSAETVAAQDEALRQAICALGAPPQNALLMTTAFIGLPVIPALKLTTRGLVDVTQQKLVPLFADR